MSGDSLLAARQAIQEQLHRELVVALDFTAQANREATALREAREEGEALQLTECQARAYADVTIQVWVMLCLGAAKTAYELGGTQESVSNRMNGLALVDDYFLRLTLALGQSVEEVMEYINQVAADFARRVAWDSVMPCAPHFVYGDSPHAHAKLELHLG